MVVSAYTNPGNCPSKGKCSTELYNPLPIRTDQSSASPQRPLRSQATLRRTRPPIHLRGVHFLTGRHVDLGLHDCPCLTLNHNQITHERRAPPFASKQDLVQTPTTYLMHPQEESSLRITRIPIATACNGQALRCTYCVRRNRRQKRLRTIRRYVATFYDLALTQAPNAEREGNAAGPTHKNTPGPPKCTPNLLQQPQGRGQHCRMTAARPLSASGFVLPKVCRVLLSWILERLHHWMQLPTAHHQSSM